MTDPRCPEQLVERASLPMQLHIDQIQPPLRQLFTQAMKLGNAEAGMGAAAVAPARLECRTGDACSHGRLRKYQGTLGRVVWRSIGSRQVGAEPCGTSTLARQEAPTKWTRPSTQVMATTRLFRNGNPQAVRIPAELANGRCGR